MEEQNSTPSKVGTFVSSAVSRILNLIMILVIIALVALVAWFFHQNELLKNDVKNLEDKVENFKKMNLGSGDRDVVMKEEVEVDKKENVNNDVAVTTINNTSSESQNNSNNKTKSTNETKDNLKTYTNAEMKLSVSYPNDGTYAIENIDLNYFTVTQEHPGNRFHIKKTLDLSMYPVSSNVKNINDINYKVFNRQGMGSGYGYVTEKNKVYYVFESTIGPKNEVFENMMKTVKFE